jgi:uncharacterized membrane protein
MHKEDIDIKAMIFTGLWVAVVTVVTMVVVIPIPLTQGYVNLGDAAVFLGAYLLHKKYGAIAAGLGSALADILLSYAAFAPFTLIIKAAMAFIFALSLKFADKQAQKTGRKVSTASIVGIVLATAVLAGGYYVAEWVLTGNSVVPIVSIPWNILQGLVGGSVALVLMAVLSGLRLPERLDLEKKRSVEEVANTAETAGVADIVDISPEEGVTDVHDPAVDGAVTGNEPIDYQSEEGPGMPDGDA